MSRGQIPAIGVGNDFVRVKPMLKPVQQISAAPSLAIPVISVLDDLTLDIEPRIISKKQSRFGRILDLLHRYSLGAFALLFLLVASSAIQVANIYQTTRLTLNTSSGQIAAHPTSRPQSGPNLIVAEADLATVTKSITAQPINLEVAGKNVAVSPDVISSWLKIVTEKSGTSYIHVDQKLIDKSLREIATPLMQPSKNQISRVNADGTSQIIASGQNGIKLKDTSVISQQISKTLLSAKGFQLGLPTETQAFANSTIADFDKLIEVNIVTKQMYLYEKGQLTHTYPISAGAVATPTPVGQFKIYQKLAVQDMRGYNANGTRYFQPHVRWISYFQNGGYAIHGNYWRPQSWFGAVNSSHGCVSLPDLQAKEVYDWAPVGTTVVTHT